MASLRRPSVAIASSKQQTRSSRGDQIKIAVPEVNRRNAARKSKVGDAIKKRMSMRYAPGVNDDFVPPPIPGQPPFLQSDPFQAGPSSRPPGRGEDYGDGDEDFDYPAGESKFHQFASPEFAQGSFPTPATAQDEVIRRRGAADLTHEEEWDLEELGKDGFDVNAFLRRNMTGADEEEKKRFRVALMRHKERNQKDLQRNVFKHYAEFVTISKEISTLENDMLELKDLLGQWKDLPQLLGMDSTLAPKLDKDGNMERRRTQRNSMLDLQQVYKTQLSTLWSTVEGSQKYLPLVPGRHLVHESHNFVELNAATYKAKQSVSMFLLNDLLLIAGRRRMKVAPGAGDERDKERERGRMIAERCWVLADLVVVDVKDSGDLTNALKIRRGKEVCVYRTSKPEDKKSLLAAFRQVSQELGEKKRKENEKEQERRKTMWLGDGAPATASAVPGHLTPGRPLSTIGLSLADSKDHRWIDEYGDDLTMAIATRDWEEALKLVERGNDLLKTIAANPAAHSLLTVRQAQLLPSLTSQITHDLSIPDIRKSSATKLISYLIRLDHAELARDTFLRARKEVMMQRVRAIRAEGDVSIYVSELGIVCFTIVRHTSDWFMTAFKENKMASGFVTWAKEQIETFADLFRRQVYAPNVDETIADECIRVTASHNRKLLRDVGLDFTFLLSTLLQPDPASTTPHPVFTASTTHPTPAPGYHIEPSPYPTSMAYAETPAIDPMDRTAASSGGARGGGGGGGGRVGAEGGGFAPLSINRRPKGARPLSGSGTPKGRHSPSPGVPGDQAPA